MLIPAGAQASMMDGIRDFLFGKDLPQVRTVEDARAELADLSKTLATLGIGPVKDAQIDSLIENYESIPAEYRDGIDLTLQLLYAIGCGDHIFDSGKWKPTSHKVYAFDTEVFDMNRMYTNFLMGVEAINRGEFSITDVQEDVSQADWDTDTGTQTIRFSYNTHPYAYAAKFYGDWLDMGVVAFMNGVFEAEGTPKRLYCCGDQIQILFYDTPEWAARFEEVTGEALSNAPFQ
jgi:hypothetical protein